jgi:uncharacterized protein YbjT (DUF2867 family)
MPTADTADQPIVLLTGGSGYVGGRLIPLLERQGVRLRCLARNPDKLRSQVQAASEVVPGDVLDPPSLDRALQGVHTAYYLVHLMSGSGSKDFEREDRQAASNFAGAAKQAGLRPCHYPQRMFSMAGLVLPTSPVFCSDAPGLWARRTGLPEAAHPEVQGIRLRDPRAPAARE